MNSEQRERLNAINEKLIDVTISDCDPDNWVASGLKLNEMSQSDRGDAQWCRKTAVQTVSLLIRVQQLIGSTGEKINEPPDIEDEIKRAERSAKEMLDRVSKNKDVAT